MNVVVFLGTCTSWLSNQASEILSGLFFLVMFVSAVFLSIGWPANGGIQAVHKVVAFLTVTSTCSVIYLLAQYRR